MERGSESKEERGRLLVIQIDVEAARDGATRRTATALLARGEGEERGGGFKCIADGGGGGVECFVAAATDGIALLSHTNTTSPEGGKERRRGIECVQLGDKNGR